LSIAILLQSSGSYSQNKLAENDIPCMKLRNMDASNLESLMYSVNECLPGNIDCIYNIIDKLADLYVYEDSFEAFSCIVAVCNNAEAPVSDYLIDINGSLFYAKFGRYTKYLNFYRKYYKEEHCLVKYLIAALSLQIAASDDETSERQVILDHINVESKKYKLSDEERNYVLSIYQKLNPGMWK